MVPLGSHATQCEVARAGSGARLHLSVTCIADVGDLAASRLVGVLQLQNAGFSKSYWKDELMQRLGITLADFREVSGLTLNDRLCGYYRWQSARRRDGSWAYDKTLHSAPLPNSSMVDGCGRHVKGPNYCSQDYLSLAKHDSIREAAIS